MLFSKSQNPAQEAALEAHLEPIDYMETAMAWWSKMGSSLRVVPPAEPCLPTKMTLQREITGG